MPMRSSPSGYKVHDDDSSIWEILRTGLAKLVHDRAKWTLITLSTNSERADWAKMGASPWWPESIDPWEYHCDIWLVKTNMSELQLALLTEADNFSHPRVNLNYACIESDRINRNRNAECASFSTFD